MQTIVQILKSARTGKKYSLRRLEEVTKIKASFIDSIEKERWESLPPFPTVLVFVKSISAPLGVDSKMTVAVLRRDYPPRKLAINPKPDVPGKPTWNPKMTFLAGVGVALTVIFGYLIFQYIEFVSPPRLSLESPKEGQVVSGSSVAVFGSTSADVKLTINGQPVLVDNNGKFSANIEITDQTKEIGVVAISRS